jgi:hypothetical protein
MHTPRILPSPPMWRPGLPLLLLLLLMMMTTTTTTATNLKIIIFDWFIVQTQLNPLCCFYQPIPQYQSYSTNLLMGMIAFNERRADILPILGTLQSCHINLTVVRLCDEGGDSLRSTYDLLDAMENDGIGAVAGYAASTDATAGNQLMYNYGKLPVVSHWSSGGDLSDKFMYPTYSRILPNDYQVAQKLATLIAQWGASTVVIMHILEDSGQSFNDQLVLDLQALNISSTSFGFNYYDYPSAYAAMEAATALNLNYFIVICYTDDVVSDIADSAVYYNAVGKDKMWLFP